MANFIDEVSAAIQSNAQVFGEGLDVHGITRKFTSEMKGEEGYQKIFRRVRACVASLKNSNQIVKRDGLWFPVGYEKAVAPESGVARTGKKDTPSRIRITKRGTITVFTAPQVFIEVERLRYKINGAWVEMPILGDNLRLCTGPSLPDWPDMTRNRGVKCIEITLKGVRETQCIDTNPDHWITMAPAEDDNEAWL